MKKFILILITLSLTITLASAKWKEKSVWNNTSEWNKNDERVRVSEHLKITKPYTTQVKIGEDCYQDTVEVNVPCGRQDTNSIGIDTIIGAALGVAIGNQFNKGKGRDAAKVIGGLLGATVANNQRENVDNCKSYETINICNPRYEYKTINKVIGWQNCVYIDGQKYCKQTNKKLQWLRIKKTITVY